MEDDSKGEVQFEKIFIIGIVIILVVFIGYQIGKSAKAA